MKKSRFTDSLFMAALKRVEAGLAVPEIYRVKRPGALQSAKKRLGKVTRTTVAFAATTHTSSAR